MTNPTEAALRELVRLTPEKPNAITHEKGWKILDHVQDVLVPAFKESLSAPAPDPVGMAEAIEEIDEAFSDYVALGTFPDTDECCAKRRQYSERMFGLIERLAQGGQSGRQEAINRMAFKLAEQDGCSDPHQLIWEGNPPEPWGEVWCKYAGQATELYDAQTPPTTTERAGA